MATAARKSTRSDASRKPSPATAPATAEPRKRRRLLPEERAGQILDVAARLVMEDGFTEISMERLGREAGISKALVYNYFPSRNDLLCALLKREHEHIRAATSAVVEKAGSDFREVLRATTLYSVINQRERGRLLARLWSEPAVARSMEAEAKAFRAEYTEYFARKIRKHYGLPLELCRTVVPLQLGLTEAAAQRLVDSQVDPETIADLCLTMIEGSLRALQAQQAPPKVSS